MGLFSPNDAPLLVLEKQQASFKFIIQPPPPEFLLLEA